MSKIEQDFMYPNYNHMYQNQRMPYGISGYSIPIPYHTPEQSPPPSLQLNPLSKKLSIDTSFINNNVTSQDSSLPSASPDPSSTVSPTNPKKKRRGQYQSINHSADLGSFFQSTSQFFPLYSADRTKSYSIQALPKIDRGFFIIEDEWTCYRRNYFQVSSALSCIDPLTGEENDAPGLVEIDGMLKPFSTFAVCVSSRLYNGDKKVDLVQHTSKRDKGPQIIPSPKQLRTGGNPHHYSGMGNNMSVVTFDRMQFKTATSTNSKRRTVQQFYVLVIEIYARLEDGSFLKVGQCESSRLVVRGRSPGHYSDVQKDRAMIELHSASTIEKYTSRDMFSMGTPMSPYPLSAYPATLMSESPTQHALSAPVFSTHQDQEYYPPTTYPPAFEGHGSDFRVKGFSQNDHKSAFTPEEYTSTYSSQFYESNIPSMEKVDSNNEAEMKKLRLNHLLTPITPSNPPMAVEGKEPGYFQNSSMQSWTETW